METVPGSVARSGFGFLVAWCAGLIALFAAVGFYGVSTLSRYKEESVARHNARIDPKATEPGRTAADDRLPEGATPRKVTVGLYLDGIASLSIPAATWSPVLYVWFRWTGDDLHPGETFSIMEGDVLSKEKLDETAVNGEHYALYKVKAQITKFFDGRRFPVDDHMLTIGFEDSSLTWERLEYVPDTAASNISSRVKMPGYVVARTGMTSKPHSYKSNFGDPRVPAAARKTFSQLVYGVWNQRPGLGTYWRVFAGLFVAVLIALLPSFIESSVTAERYGIGIGAFFGAVANMFISSSMVPDAGVLTMLDIVNGLGILTIFLTLVKTTIVHHLYSRIDDPALARRFDLMTVTIIAIAYTTINVLLPIAARV